MNHDHCIEVKNLNFFYPNGRGINDVSFYLNKSEVLCFFGKNGSGKSTLIRVLSTLQKPDSGSFYVFGVDGIKKRQDVRKYIFPVFDENAHFDFATGQVNYEFFSKLYQKSGSADYENMRKHLDLDLGLKTKEFSLGMNRKLYLLEAFLIKKEILLLDEPSLGLDSETRDKVFRLMTDQKNNGVSIIFGTNRVEEAKNADRILYLENGKMKEVDSLDNFLNKMLTVKIYTKDRFFIDYIDVIDELPNLIKKYLVFGTPKQIEIIGEEESIWTKEALEKIERAPKFVSKMIYNIVNSYAQENGYMRITPEIVDEARKKYEKK